MKIAIPKERREHERRVAGSPDTVKKYVSLGFDVTVETGAGDGASIPDQEFADAGAIIAGDEAATLVDADIILKVQCPIGTNEDGPDEIALMKKGAILVGHLGALQHRDQIAAYEKAGITAFAMELVPRIARAQAMGLGEGPQQQDLIAPGRVQSAPGGEDQIIDAGLVARGP